MSVNYIIFSGESNSGGFGQNSDLAPEDLLIRRPQVQYFNPYIGTFDDLQIGVNNQLGHLDDTYRHGWELELSKQTNRLRGQTYMQKTGRGGSKIAEWAPDFTINNVNYANDFLSRNTSAINLIKILEPAGTQVNLSLWYSQAINDINGGTTAEVWQTKTIERFRVIKEQFPGIKIFIADTPPSFRQFSTNIRNVANNVSDCYFINSDGTGGDLHWGAFGFRIMADRFLDSMVANFPASAFAANSRFISRIRSKFRLQLKRSFTLHNTQQLR